MNNVDPCFKKYFMRKVFGVSAFHCGRAKGVPSD